MPVTIRRAKGSNLKDNVEKLKTSGKSDDAQVAEAIETHDSNVKKSVKKMKSNPANKERVKRFESNAREASSEKPPSVGGWF